MFKDLGFPTTIHSQAAEAVVDFFSRHSRTNAVVLVNSCARGTAVPESDLDFAILVDPPLTDPANQELERDWQESYAANPVFRQLEGLSPFARVHLDLFDGRWIAERWDDGGGPDSFEIKIGNRVAHAVPIWEQSHKFGELRASRRLTVSTTPFKSFSKLYSSPTVSTRLRTTSGFESKLKDG